MDKYNILIFGDSITYGVLDQKFGGWVNQLKIILEKSKNNDYYIYNLGVSGNDTNDIIKRIKTEVENRLKDNAQLIIINSIGINDTKIINSNIGTEKSLFENNIKKIINICRKYTNNICFVGLNNVDETKTNPYIYNKEKSYINNTISEYNGIIEQSVKKEKLYFVDLFGSLLEDDFYDGLHPNYLGHDKICNLVKDKLKLIIGEDL